MLNHSIKKEKTMSKVNYDKLNKFILSAIDFDGYEPQYQDLKTDAEKLQALHAVFMEEVGKWNAPQVGTFNSLVYWLSGLPSVINLPFYNCDILDMAVKTGTLSKKASEAERDRVIERYFPFMAMRILRLWRKAGIEV